MKIKKGFVMRTIMGQHIIVAEGPEHVNFNKIISMNPSATLLWTRAEGRDFTIQDMADALVEEYKIDPAQARDDAAALVNDWIANGLVED